MLRRRVPLLNGLIIAVVTISLASSGCSTPDATTTSRSSELTSTTATPTTQGSGPRIVLSPEFVNGVIPESRLVFIVGLADRGGAATISAEAQSAEVVVDPPTIAGTAVAEVTVVPDATETETTVDVTVTAAEGDRRSTITRTVTVVPWEDDREDEARRILGLFVDWLADIHPELGITPETSFSGTYTAPLLLVVSHYVFYSDEWEAGVSWHIMVPPDDFAEMYLRPRTGLQPTHAFRIDSWQTALDGGTPTVTEVAPPVEVIR